MGCLQKLFFLISLSIDLSYEQNDINFPPSFVDYNDTITLSENTPVGQIVYTLKGKDPENSTIKYGLFGTDKFEVNPLTGEMTLVKPLDREENESLRFQVSIEDNVDNGLKNNIVQLPISVIVYDENDNAPTFKNSPYEVNVAENEEIGKTLLDNIIVEDSDTVGLSIEVGCVPDEEGVNACDIFKIKALQSSQNYYQGALLLKSPLNYNDKQFYQFKLYATDGSLNSSTSIEVKVLDIQNLPPVFTSSMATSISEDTPIGTIILALHAHDGDRAQPRNISYDLITNPFDFFLLDSTTGELKTAKPLDREILEDPSSPLNITVRAREIVNGSPVTSNLTTTHATVTITIKDVNDEPPRFNRAEYYVEIPENIAPGTPLPNLDMMVTDTDLGMNSAFTLRLSDVSGAFTVEPTDATGSTQVSIRLNNTQLDYENPNERKFILVVIAEELHTNPRLSSKATVTVSVTDVNDNSPKFSETAYTAKVLETAGVGTPVISLTATDRDSGRFGTEGLVYELSGSGEELFHVDNRSGVITVAECESPGLSPCLDYERKQDYYLSYKATDNDGTGQWTVVSLKISLVDANDNPPVFNMQVYRASIDEDSSKFEPELQVTARDADKTSEIRYSLIKEDSVFYIDNISGKIGVKPERRVQLYGDTDNHILLNVMATDGAHNDTCVIDVTIRDVNNHPPMFDLNVYNVSVQEDVDIGKEVARLTAHDLDKGENADIKYHIQKGALEAFTIDEDSGIVTVAAKLDYDKKDIYRITVVASDQGIPSLKGTAELVVNIVNANDKSPYFTPTIQQTEIFADVEVGSPIHNLLAEDPDVIDYKDLTFDISEMTPIRAVDNNGNEVLDTTGLLRWFTVLPNGTVIVTSRIDRNIAAVITLPVTVTDSSASTLQRAEGKLTITIVDVNRFPPVFPNSHYIEQMEEEQPIGTVLNTYQATDRDSMISHYQIQPDNEYFQIDNLTGVVRSAKRIDYEQIQKIEFVIVAYDLGEPQLSSTAGVTVNVVNLNDEEPKFDNPRGYLASVLENSKEGTPVVTVHATDADEGQYGEIRYNISGESATLFTINTISGEIAVARNANIDSETTTDIYLEAVAYDNSPVSIRKSTTVPIHIKVLDDNDNSPIFTQHEYTSTIADNVPYTPPTPILQVRAEDKDTTANVTYMIHNQTLPGTFEVDSKTGLIYVVKNGWELRKHVIWILASDGLHADVVSLVVTVTALNTHTPKFITPGDEQDVVFVSETAQPNQVILTVSATDDDWGENGRISYYLKVNNKNVHETNEFSLDQVTGELRNKVFLDREHKAHYKLVLVAADNGKPVPFEALHFLTVELKDDDDNLPEFTKETYEFSIMENQPPGVIVGAVKAIDRDSDDYGKVYYHIVEGNDNASFTLDRVQGVIRTAKTFDREEHSEYSLTIYASNSPLLNSTTDDNSVSYSFDNDKNWAHIVINILDENDNSPEFEHKLYYAAIKSSSNINEHITSVQAIDKDYDTNGTVSYVIASSNLFEFGSEHSSGSVVPSPFNITQDGMLHTASFMAEYTQDRFVLDITAQEQAPPNRYAKTQVYLWVVSPESIIRVIVSQPCSQVQNNQRNLTANLSRAIDAVIIVSAIKHYVHTSRLYDDWCEVHIHAVDQSTWSIIPTEDILTKLDTLYDSLSGVYKQAHIESVVAATTNNNSQEGIDIALAALIAILVILFTGIVTFIVVCSCLKHWDVAVPSIENVSKSESIVHRRILEELSSTENPLWLENKLKPYEEQELTMHVFGDQQDLPPQVDNTYATIAGNGGGGGNTTEYATLGRDTNAQLEAMLGFQGSTFQPPTLGTPEPPPRLINHQDS